VVFHACEPTTSCFGSAAWSRRLPGIAPADLSSGPIDTFYDICAVLGFGEPASWERLLRAETDVIADIKPDVIVADMRPSAPLSAARYGVPLVSCAWAGADPRQHATGEHPYDELARSVAANWSGLALTSMAELMYWRADCQLALSFPVFEPELADAPAVVYTGYLRDSWRSRDERPAIPERLVVVYASRRHGSARDRRRTGRGGAAGRCHGVVRPAVGQPGLAAFDRCQVFRFLPMDEVLPESAALVFHGG